MKLLKKIGITILCLLLICGIGIVCLFHNEYSSLKSLKKIDAYPMYTMDYSADYGLDEFLEKGASNDKELVEFVVNHVMKGLPLSIKIPDLGCSTFIAQNKDSGYLFGRNFDMDYSPSVLLKTKPKNGYASVSMVNLGFVGYNEKYLPDTLKDSLVTLAAPYAPLDGMNEKGLAVGVLLIDTKPTNQNTKKVDITTTTAIRMMLDKAKNVDEALELLSSYDMHSSANSCYHFQICDASGKSVVVEYVDNEMKVVYPNTNYQCATNFLLTQPDAEFNFGQDRYQIIDEKLSSTNGKLSNREAMQLLSDCSQDAHKNNQGKISKTQWSCVYDLKNKKVTVCVNQNYDAKYTISVLE